MIPWLADRSSTTVSSSVSRGRIQASPLAAGRDVVETRSRPLASWGEEQQAPHGPSRASDRAGSAGRRKSLIVLDGFKALRKAVRLVFASVSSVTVAHVSWAIRASETSAIPRTSLPRSQRLPGSGPGVIRNQTCQVDGKPEWRGWCDNAGISKEREDFAGPDRRTAWWPRRVEFTP